MARAAGGGGDELIEAPDMAAPAGRLLAHGGGGGGLPPFTWTTAFTEWIFDPYLAAAVAAAAGLYLAGAARLRGRGDRWPVGRGVVFLGAGLGSIMLATMASPGAYDDTLFSAHVVQHLLLNMVAPAFLALGAPVTLALRTLPPRGRAVLRDVLHSRVVRVLSHPVVGFPLFTSTLFWLYFTPLYEITLRNDLVHEWLHFHMLLTGCLFLWPIIGIDPFPNRLPYLGRLAATLLTMPVHIIVGISLMMRSSFGTGLIAGDYYRELAWSWGPSLLADQWLGGAILWGAGDFIAGLYAAVLIPQWIRAHSRESHRVDRHLDRLEDADIDLTVPWWQTTGNPARPTPEPGEPEPAPTRPHPPGGNGHAPTDPRRVAARDPPAHHAGNGGTSRTRPGPDREPAAGIDRDHARPDGDTSPDRDTGSSGHPAAGL